MTFKFVKKKKEEDVIQGGVEKLLTPVEAAYSAGHGLREDHPVLLGGTSIFTMRVMIHPSLRDTQRHVIAQKTFTRLQFCFQATLPMAAYR